LLFCMILLLKDFPIFVCEMFLFSWTILIIFFFVGVLFKFVVYQKSLHQWLMNKMLWLHVYSFSSFWYCRISFTHLNCYLWLIFLLNLIIATTLYQIIDATIYFHHHQLNNAILGHFVMILVTKLK
jgi:hypothetical protein